MSWVAISLKKLHFSSSVTPSFKLIYQPSNVYPSLLTSGILIRPPSMTLTSLTVVPPFDSKVIVTFSSSVHEKSKKRSPNKNNKLKRLNFFM